MAKSHMDPGRILLLAQHLARSVEKSERDRLAIRVTGAEFDDLDHHLATTRPITGAVMKYDRVQADECYVFGVKIIAELDSATVTGV